MNIRDMKKAMLGSQLLNEKSLGEMKPFRATNEKKTIGVEQIEPNPLNKEPLNNIEELAVSLRVDKIHQPLEVYPIGKGKDGKQHYRIYSGHRRYAAIQKNIELGYEKEFENIDVVISPAPEDYVINIDNKTYQLDKDIIEAYVMCITNENRSASIKGSLWRYQSYKNFYNSLKSELKKKNERFPGDMRSIIANMMNESNTSVQRYAFILKNLIPELKLKLDTTIKSALVGDRIAHFEVKVQEELNQYLEEFFKDTIFQTNDLDEFIASKEFEKKQQYIEEERSSEYEPNKSEIETESNIIYSDIKDEKQENVPEKQSNDSEELDNILNSNTNKSDSLEDIIFNSESLNNSEFKDININNNEQSTSKLQTLPEKEATFVKHILSPEFVSSTNIEKASFTDWEYKQIIKKLNIIKKNIKDLESLFL